MSDDLDPDRDEGFLAAEYALGVLQTRDRRLAERLMREDATFAADVAAWEGRLGPLALATTPVPAPAGLWPTIESELPVPRAPVPLTSAAVAGARRRVSAFWQWLAIGSLGVAAASLAGLAVVSNAPAGPTFAASIAAADGVALFTAVIDPANGEAILVPVSTGQTAGGVPELWFIPAGGAPISLGVIDPQAPLRVDLSPGNRSQARVRDRNDGALAISLEPAGGSPTGQPTGPVVGQGALHSV